MLPANKGVTMAKKYITSPDEFILISVAFKMAVPCSLLYNVRGAMVDLFSRWLPAMMNSP